MNIKKVILAVLVAATMVIGVGIYFKYSPTSCHWFPRCPTKILTGLSCPGCGIQRAVHALLNGRLLEALSYNYFFVISIPYTIAIILAWGLRKANMNSNILVLFEHRRAAQSYVIAFFAWFFIRNIFNI